MTGHPKQQGTVITGACSGIGEAPPATSRD